MESGAKYRFDCGLWLAKGEDNGEIMRELPATGPLIKDPAPLLDYKVHVYTGHKRGAGTDANVSCTIYGSKGTPFRCLPLGVAGGTLHVCMCACLHVCPPPPAIR